MCGEALEEIRPAVSVQKAASGSAAACRTRAARPNLFIVHFRTHVANAKFSTARRAIGERLSVGFGALYVWEFPDGDWCYLDQLWCLQWRYKPGAVIALWWDGAEGE